MESMELPDSIEPRSKHRSPAGFLLAALGIFEDQKSPFLIISGENSIGKSMRSGRFSTKKYKNT